MTEYSTRYLVPTFNGLVAQIGFSTGVSVVCLGIFEWNRRKKTLQYLYSPRCRLGVDPSPEMSLKFLGWIIPTINIPEEFYIANIGLDAVMFLRFLKMCLQFCVFNAIVVGTILLPIHYTAGGGMTEVTRMSISNVPDDSNLLWAHVFLTYLITISWMFLIFKNYWQWMDLRREYTLRRIREGEIAERSIFISRLPSTLRSDEALKEYFESLKMGPVETATVVQHCGRLSQKIDRREGALNMLEKAHIELARSVLESVKAGKFDIDTAMITSSNSHSPLTKAALNPLSSAASTNDNALADSHDQPVANSALLESMSKDFYADEKWFRKIRKSIFARKRLARPVTPFLPAPPTVCATTSSHHAVVIEEEKGSNHHVAIAVPQQQAPPSIWHALAGLERCSLDKLQPTRLQKPFHTGERVESIDYFVKKYNKLDRKVEELRDGSLRYKSTSFGFVTFKHHLSAQLCAQSKIDSRPQGLSVSLAMEPRDVLWSNLTASFRNRFTRSIAVDLSIWLLIVFWVFPTSSFLLLTSLGQLSARFTFLKPILEASPLVQSLLQNVLPIVFVTVFLAMAPVVILAISKQGLPVSHSALEESVFRRYYHFLIFNILFVFMIGTAILKSILVLIQQPTNVFTLLAENLPAGSTFFIFYIVFNTCTHTLELVQVWGQLAIHSFATARKLTPTPRSFQRATTPWNFQFYYYYPQNILALVITFIYSVINPLILYAAVFFFGFAYVIFKYQFAYCYVRKFENSGRFFRHVFQYSTDGLLIFQITMAGVLWLKSALVGGFFIVVLIGLTVSFKILCGNLFQSRTQFLPLDTGLRDLDQESSMGLDESQTPASFSAQSSGVGSGLRRRNVATEVAREDGNLEVDMAHQGQGTGPESLGPFSRLRPGSRSSGYEKLGASDPSQQQEEQPSSVESEKMVLSVAPNTRPFGSSRDEKELAFNCPGSRLSRIHPHDTIDSSIEGLSIKSDYEEQTPGEVVGQGQFMGDIQFFLGRTPTVWVPAYGHLTPHFDHVPSKLAYQDRTSDFETYTHPALLKPLNRKLWLPNNPLYEHWDVDDTIEIDFTLCSSSTYESLKLRTQKESNAILQSPRVPVERLLQRRNTLGSNYDGAGAPMPSPGRWEGCLSDSPPSSPLVGPPLRIADRQKSIQIDLSDPPRPFNVVRLNTTGHDPLPMQGNPQLSQSISLTGVRVFSPGAPQQNARMEELNALSESPESTRTAFKRSASMPLELSGVIQQMDCSPAQPGSAMMTPLQQQPTPTLQLQSTSIPRPPIQSTPLQCSPNANNRSTAALTVPQSPGGNQIARVSFVNEATSPPSSLTVRSTMFGAPLIVRRGSMNQPGAQDLTSAAITSGGLLGVSRESVNSTLPSSATSGGASRRQLQQQQSQTGLHPSQIRSAGAFFNMLFGNYDDDDFQKENDEKSRFGYETSGHWNHRRGSRDTRHDVDDEDDEDDEQDLVVKGKRKEGEQRARPCQTPEATLAGVPVIERLGMEDLQHGQPSHLDLSDTL